VGELSRGVIGDVSVSVRSSMEKLRYTVLIPTQGWEFIPFVLAQAGSVVVVISWQLDSDDKVSFTVAGISVDSGEAEATRNRVRDEIHTWPVAIDNPSEGDHPVPDGSVGLKGLGRIRLVTAAGEE
jgi:hypothetical protein